MLAIWSALTVAALGLVLDLFRGWAPLLGNDGLHDSLRWREDPAGVV